MVSAQAHPSGHAYRPDIDGLRALAVLPVLLYHADVPGFSGGFIGVDIFFVISGFLITGIIAREVDEGRFSLLTFYERRARRILPALLAMIAFVLAGSAWLFLPADFEKVAPSAMAAILFLANVWLFTQTGYFQGDAETTPLLHTWSLGVEEQFYIGVPILLILIARLAPGWRLRSLIALSAISFVWALAKQADPDGFAFYMLPTRAWELFAGSLLALGAVPRLKQRWLREGLGLIALAAMVWAIVRYDHTTVFPGAAALVPVVGACVMIHCAPGTMIGRALSLKGPVAIGLISYSLYLWHWPLIVFWNYSQPAAITGWQSAGLILVSLFVAWLSWRFIEQPFRSKTRFPAPRVWRWSALGMGATATASAALIVLGGWESRLASSSLEFARAQSDFSPLRSECVTSRLEDFPKACLIGANAEPTALVWGDSHAVEIAWVLGEEFAARGQSLIQRTRGSCPPAVGFAPTHDPECATFNANVLKEVAGTPSIQRVYIAGYWASHSDLGDGMAERVDTAVNELRSLGKSVVLIGPVPNQRQSVPRLLALHGEAVQTRLADDFNQHAAWLTQLYPDWRAQGVTIIDPLPAFTRRGRTIIVSQGTPLFYDSHHLSIAGARYLLKDHLKALSSSADLCSGSPQGRTRDDDTICSGGTQRADGAIARTGDQRGRAHM